MFLNVGQDSKLQASNATTESRDHGSRFDESGHHFGANASPSMFPPPPSSVPPALAATTEGSNTSDLFKPSVGSPDPQKMAASASVSRWNSVGNFNRILQPQQHQHQQHPYAMLRPQQQPERQTLQPPAFCCPQCKLPSFNINVRLVREACGHLKCRQCLMQEDAGCLQCLQLLHQQKGFPLPFQPPRQSLHQEMPSADSSLAYGSNPQGIMPPATIKVEQEEMPPSTPAVSHAMPSFDCLPAETFPAGQMPMRSPGMENANSPVTPGASKEVGDMSPENVVLPPEVDATCSGSSTGQEAVDEQAVQQQLEDFRKKMGGVQRWMEVADFAFLDDELEWLQFQYINRRHDALVNKKANEEVVERGKMVALQHMAKVEALVTATAANEREASVFEAPPAKAQKLSPLSAAPATPSHLSPPTMSAPPTPLSIAPSTPATPMPGGGGGVGRGRGKRKRNSIDPDNYAHVIRVDEGLEAPEYRCTICKRQFKNRLNIRYHIACADASAGHACKECGRVFKSSSHLTYHMRTAHDGEKPYKCRYCEKAFAQSVKLKRHERTHTGERPFRCETCGHTFTTKYNLKEHENIHKSEKPYICSWCGTGFADRNNLRRHESTHASSGDGTVAANRRANAAKAAAAAVTGAHLSVSVPDPTSAAAAAMGMDAVDSKDFFSCDFCHRLCSSADELSRHQRACHCDERGAHNCRMCRIMFASRDNLLAHVRKRHMDVAAMPQQQQQADTEQQVQAVAAAAAAATLATQRRMTVAAAVILQQRHQYQMQQHEQEQQVQQQVQQQLQRFRHHSAGGEESQASTSVRINHHSGPSGAETKVSAEMQSKMSEPLFPISRVANISDRQDFHPVLRHPVEDVPSVHKAEVPSPQNLARSPHGPEGQGDANISRNSLRVPSINPISTSPTPRGHEVVSAVENLSDAKRITGELLSATDMVRSKAFLQVKELLKQIGTDEINRVVESLSSKERRTLISILKAESAVKKLQKHTQHARPGEGGKSDAQRGSRDQTAVGARVVATDSGERIDFRVQLSALTDHIKMLPPAANDQIDAFSDISTGSKKEFLRRYKRQILCEDTGSVSSRSSGSTGTSSFLFPTAVNSITPTERQQLMDDIAPASAIDVEREEQELDDGTGVKNFKDNELPGAAPNSSLSKAITSSFEGVIKGIHSSLTTRGAQQQHHHHPRQRHVPASSSRPSATITSGEATRASHARAAAVDLPPPPPPPPLPPPRGNAADQEGRDEPTRVRSTDMGLQKLLLFDDDGAQKD